MLGRSVFNLISSGAQLAGLAAGGAVIAAIGPSATFALAAAVQLRGWSASSPCLARAAASPTQAWRAGETWRGNLDLLRDDRVRRILLSWWLPITLLVGAESLAVAYVGEVGRVCDGDRAAAGGVPRWRCRGRSRRRALVARGGAGDVRCRGCSCSSALALLPLGVHPPVVVAAGCVGGGERRDRLPARRPAGVRGRGAGRASWAGLRVARYRHPDRPGTRPGAVGNARRRGRGGCHDHRPGRCRAPCRDPAGPVAGNPTYRMSTSMPVTADPATTVIEVARESGGSLSSSHATLCQHWPPNSSVSTQTVYVPGSRPVIRVTPAAVGRHLVHLRVQVVPPEHEGGRRASVSGADPILTLPLIAPAEASARCHPGGGGAGGDGDGVPPGGAARGGPDALVPVPAGDSNPLTRRPW